MAVIKTILMDDDNSNPEVKEKKPKKTTKKVDDNIVSESPKNFYNIDTVMTFIILRHLYSPVGEPANYLKDFIVIGIVVILNQLMKFIKPYIDSFMGFTNKN